MKSPSPLFGRPVQAALVMLALLAVPYATPRMKRLRVVRLPWQPSEEVAETTGGTLPVVPAPIASVGELAIGATENKGSVTNALPAEKSAAEEAREEGFTKAGAKPEVEFEDPDGALYAFYKRLDATEQHTPGATTRILHYGDSVLTSDQISGTARRRFQERFGDTGHGFILTANAWDWYFHNDVFHAASDGWSVQRIVGPWTPDGCYGPGAVAFSASGPANATFGTSVKGEYGRLVSRFDVYYLEQPGGGDFDAQVEGGATESVRTRGERRVSRVLRVQVPDGAGKLRIRARGNGTVRMFGVALERDQPGVVYDALGINGARAYLLGEQMNAEHWREVMDLRDPALVILNFGTNESEAGIVDPTYADQLGGLIEKTRLAAPQASILVLSPMDRASKSEGGELKSRKVILDLVQAQRTIALAHHVAFYNLFEAMGGKGTMARWVKMNPPLGTMDLTHPTPAGGEVLGNLLFQATLRAYAKYKERPTEGRPETRP